MKDTQAKFTDIADFRAEIDAAGQFRDPEPRYDVLHVEEIDVVLVEIDVRSDEKAGIETQWLIELVEEARLGAQVQVGTPFAPVAVDRRTR